MAKKPSGKKAAAEVMSTNQGGRRGNGQSVGGYFRAIFTENPKLLDSRSNEEMLNRWLADHPGETQVPGRIKAILSNLKSVLRKKRRNKPGRKKSGEQPAGLV